MNNLQRTEQNQILVFTLDEPRYALSLAAVERVVRAVEITPLPEVPPVVQGVINVQGQIVPVVNIRKRLNLPAREMRLDDQFIIARTSRRLVALVVDFVVGVRALAEQELVSAAQALPYAAYIHSVARVDDRLILICNLDQFLSPMEERMLAETIARARGMNSPLPDSLLAELSAWVAAKTALHFPREKWGDLARKANSAAQEFGYADVEAFIHWLVSSPLSQEQVEILAGHLTIAETYFWREPQVFAALGEQILPELIRARDNNGDRRLRIWSAGCATGEEPYSLAIALRRALPTLENWRITILATDINPRILRRAAAGVYGEWSFRNAPPWLKGGYFSQRPGSKWEILPEIRQMVTFAYLNLAEDVYPSPLNNTNAMDMIFCRNVLMYFAPERARQVGRHLHSALTDGGWLMVASSELSQGVFSQFAPVNFPGAIVYRKKALQAPPWVAFRPEETPPATAMIRPLEEPAAVAPVAPPLPRHKRENVPPPTAHAQALDLHAHGRYVEITEKPKGVETPGNSALDVRALANQGKLAEALALCEQAIAANKLDPGIHYLGATILQEQNREGEAIAALKRALYLDPNFALAHFALGNLMLRQGNVPVARRSFQNVLALLGAYQQDDILPESEGLTAGRFREIIQATIKTGALGVV